MVVYVLRRYTLLTAAAAVVILSPSLNAGRQQDGASSTYGPLPVVERDFSDDVPAHVSVVDGAATLERDGKSQTAEENVILLAGDRLRTGRGRVEVLFDDGSALHLDDNSGVDLMSDSLVRLREGRLRLQVARSSNAIEYRVDAAPASTIIRAAGEYRISLSASRESGPELHVVVMRGSAEVSNEGGRTTVRTGNEAWVAMGLAPSLASPVNSAYDDQFERWAQHQIDARLSVESARYLPAEVSNYGGVFDNYGTWNYESAYGGYAWFPRVAIGWRPYYSGRWAYVGHYGWTWYGYDRWAWPTHHYGRWGYSPAGWHWIPGSYWGPSWVAWAYAPGYVSWCPLGYNGAPVYGFGYSMAGRYNSWNAWTVVPSYSFVPSMVVASHMIRPETIPVGVRGQFAEQRRAPAAPLAVARATEPIRSPTGQRAVARNAAPSASPSTSWPDRAQTAPAGSGANYSRAPRDQAAPRGGSAITPVIPRQMTPEPERVSPSRSPSRSMSSSWPANQDVGSGDSRQSEPRATPRSRVPDDTTTPASGSDSNARWSRTRPTESTPPPAQTPTQHPSAPRWGAPESRGVEPVSPPTSRFPSRSPSPSNDAPTAAPRGGYGSRMPPSASPSRGGAESRQAPPSASPSRGGGESRSAPATAAPSRGGGGGESRPAPASGPSRGRGGQSAPRPGAR
jgi:hypothetical protein